MDPSGIPVSQHLVILREWGVARERERNTTAWMWRRPVSRLLVAAVCLSIAGSLAARGSWTIAAVLFAVGAIYIALFVSLVRVVLRIRRTATLEPNRTDHR